MNIDSRSRNDSPLLFPYVFVRYASGHHSEFGQLKMYDWISFSSDLKTVDEELKVVKDLLCDYLFREVSNTATIPEKQVLIDAKRDIYNERDVRELDRLSDIKPDLETHLFHRYILLKERKEASKLAWKQYYEEHLSKDHASVRELASNELFLKGIRLSSKDLFDQMVLYLNDPIENLTSKQLKIEYSLLRYLTRMYFKTSPFSTFTHVGLADVRASTVPLQLPSGYSVKSRVRLNNRMFDHIKNLLSTHPEINDSLFIIFNPTITLKGQSVSFLINFHNLESFQTIEGNPVIHRLLEIRDSQRRSISLKKMVGYLSNEIDATETAIKNYLLNLIEIGFLEFDFRVSALSPDWDTSLIEQLQTHESPSPLLHETINVLRSQRSNCGSYESSEASKRNIVLQEMFSQCQSLFEGFMEPLGLRGIDKQAYKKEYQKKFDTNSFKRLPYLLSTLTAENIIYEDSYTSDIGYIDERSLKGIVEKINELGKFLAPFNNNSDQRMQTSRFFMERYEIDQEVALLDFYRDYYTVENQKREPEQQRVADEQGNRENEITAQYSKWFSILKESLKSVITTETDELFLTKQLFDGSEAENPQEHIITSRAMFAQLYVENNSLKAVVNNVFLGMGRACGRFLHLFDQEVTEKQRALNHGVSNGHLLMELSDGSFFNANLHPPLLPYELKIPNGHTGLPAAQQIAAKDILLYFDATIGEVCLREKVTGKQIIPYDLCLQTISQRSKLYQLLAQFAMDPGINFIPVRQAVQELLYGEGDSFEHRDVYPMPRLVYEGQVILKRKSWTVRTLSLPKKKELQGEEAYFMEVNEWRISHNIPAQVFLYIKLGADGENRGRSDDYKPQYICFETPLMVIMWSKLLKKAGEHIYMEEMLPDQRRLNGNTVNETLVQWYGL